MEGIKKVGFSDRRENESSSSSANGKPPTPIYRRCVNGAGDFVESSSIKKSLIRHSSLPFSGKVALRTAIRYSGRYARY
ncbi:hypothetical protein R6Q57_016510 [Mikania cordata]